MKKQPLTSAQFLSAAYVAVDTIYIKSEGGAKVTAADLARAEQKAEETFDAQASIILQSEDVNLARNVDLSPNYETEVLTVNVAMGEMKMSVDLYLGDYGIDLVKND